VGKTTVAAALGLEAAREGADTLVMTFDPSMRLKDALGVGERATRAPVRVPLELPGRLEASLLDARTTFDRLVDRYAPDERARTRIFENRFYRHLAGRLAGILEYMAVERLYEVADEDRYDRIVLDTPPTAQALDFLEAPGRIVGFLESGATRIAMKPWFDEQGRLRPTRRLGPLGRRFERFLDDIVGLDLLRDMAEFFQAFGPLFDGFRQRASDVESLLRSERTTFVLVTGPERERIPETLFFARKLGESGYRLRALIANRVHPDFGPAIGAAGDDPGAVLLRWLGQRDRRGLDEMRSLLPRDRLIELPLLPDEPVDLDSLRQFGLKISDRLSAVNK